MRVAIGMAGDAQGVETAVGRGVRIVALQPSAGGAPPFLLFAWRDGFQRADWGAGSTQAHFGKNDDAAVVADEINFAAADAHVARENAYAVVLEMLCGKCFAFAAAQEVEEVFHGADYSGA